MILVEGRTINGCSTEVPAGAARPGGAPGGESDRPSLRLPGIWVCTRKALRTWVRQDDADRGERDDRLTTVEREQAAAKGSGGAAPFE
jgi:hypothetical protein